VNRKTLVLAALPAAAILALTGCGSDSDAAGHAHTSSHVSVHTEQDVAFAQGMIPHHQQAITMARLAAAHAGSAQVKELAARIEGAQRPEITTMTRWLRAWGATTTMPGMDMSGMDMGDMPGMMSGAEMKQLSRADGAEFDRLFLRGMITHHRGALAMARDEIARGKNSDATALAERIRAAQAREITLMHRLLTS